MYPTQIPLHTDNASHAAAGIPVGISACLLGAPVRYDGGHKRDGFCAGELSQWFAWTAVCPETAIGLGSPREAIHLRRAAGGELRLVGVRSGVDHTDTMRHWAGQAAAAMGDLCGYVVAKRSPTCGLERVKVYNAAGMPDRAEGTGLYTEIFRSLQPLVPVEEEGRLHDPLLRENFVSRVFVLSRWRQLRSKGISAKALIDFHAAHKYLLMAHDVAAYRACGRLLADLSGNELDAIADAYIAALMAALAKPATRGGHVNTLQHLAGYFRRHLPAAHKQRLQALIADYRAGLVPLSVPLALLAHFLADFPDRYVQQQVYLAPHPHQLRLRSFQ